jgi:hypothetical protein
MSFTIKFSFQDPSPSKEGGVAHFTIQGDQETEEYSKHLLYSTLLSTQSNQISGINSGAGEQFLSTCWEPGSDKCPTCNNLDMTRLNPGWTPVVAGFIESFIATADQGCQFCQLLVQAISPCAVSGRMKAFVRAEGALNVIVKSADKNARYDIFTETGTFKTLLKCFLALD